MLLPTGVDSTVEEADGGEGGLAGTKKDGMLAIVDYEP